MRVLLIDDHSLVRKGIEQLLLSRGVDVVASVGTGAEGLNQARALSPDIILLDIKMPGMSGIDTLSALRTSGIDIPVLMLTMSREDADLHAALRTGAQGYLLKDMDPEDLIPALEAANRGEKIVAKEMVSSLARLVSGPSENSRTPSPSPHGLFNELTPREYEILTHVASGANNKTIARDLNITDGTVKLHVKSILRKLGVHSRVEAAVLAVENGLGRKKEPDSPK